MKTVEKVAYLKGLAEGLNLNSDKPETKMFNAIMEVLKELAESHEDLEDSLDLVAAQLDGFQLRVAGAEELTGKNLLFFIGHGEIPPLFCFFVY